jgi:hypothetical protein
MFRASYPILGSATLVTLFKAGKERAQKFTVAAWSVCESHKLTTRTNFVALHDTTPSLHFANLRDGKILNASQVLFREMLRYDRFKTNALSSIFDWTNIFAKI